MSITLDGSNVSTVGVINSATAQNTTSGTIITFTGIPAGVKRITMMLNGVSTSGTSDVMIQIGSGSLTTTGYLGMGSRLNAGGSGYTANTNGFRLEATVGGGAASTRYGLFVLTNLTGNTWVLSGQQSTDSAAIAAGYGSLALSGVLDRMALTTFNGTDTFDAGSVNILYE